MTMAQPSTHASGQPKPSGGRGRRMQFTANPMQERLLRRAACCAGKPVAAFVAETSCAAAYQVLMGDPNFSPDDQDWEYFLRLLGQSAEEKGRLMELLQSGG